MFTDTHCHLNMMVKKAFDTALTPQEVKDSHAFIVEAQQHDITKIINVGTSLIESQNCLMLARHYRQVYASVGIHPNDATVHWQEDFRSLISYVQHHTTNNIIAIGECGMDFHYPDFDKDRQLAVFRSHIELALEHNLALIIHSRDAAHETLACLTDYKAHGLRGTFHCFSYDLAVAREAIALGFVLGIGGTITYPKNDLLRSVVKEVGIEHLILETDAPFLPPQSIRGKQNHPKYLQSIAVYLSELLELPLDAISRSTEKNVHRIFGV